MEHPFDIEQQLKESRRAILPPGGLGQRVLAKNSSDDYDVAWHSLDTLLGTDDGLTIGELADANPLDGTEFVPIEQDAVSVKTTTQQIADLSTSAGTGSPLGLYGDGSDGTIDFDGTTTRLGLIPSAGVYSLNRDIHLADGSQVSGTAVILTNNFRIFCRGTLTIGALARIHNNGANGSGQSAGGGGPQGTTPQGTGGGNGGNGGGNGNNAGSFTYMLGASGGAGGGASGGPGTGGGGSGGAASNPAANGNARNLIQAMNFTKLPQSNDTQYLQFLAGAGGGGGHSTASSIGGGGGGGGNSVAIYAQHLVNNGAIEAKGGNGTNASGSGTGAGGGGGGGGGIIVLVYETLAGNAASAAGGTGGNAQGAGKNGVAGSAGTVVTIGNS